MSLTVFSVAVLFTSLGAGVVGAILGLGTALFLFISGVVVRERPEFQGRPAMNPYAGIVAQPALRILGI